MEIHLIFEIDERYYNDKIFYKAVNTVKEAEKEIKKRKDLYLIYETHILEKPLEDKIIEVPKPYQWLKEEKFNISKGETYRDPKVTLTQCAGWISEYVKKYYL